MATKLDRLLNDIHPSRTVDEPRRRADEALNSLRTPRGGVRDRHEFRSLMTRTFVHIECAALRMGRRRTPHPTMDWARCCEMFKRIYGPEGEYVAIQKALHGHDGGLFSVTRDLAASMAEEYARNEISARVAAYWGSLTVDEKLAASKEYIAKYARLLPPDVAENGAARLRAYFPKFLEKHPFLVQTMSRIGR